jgi:hypothetical protein
MKYSFNKEISVNLRFFFLLKKTQGERDFQKKKLKNKNIFFENKNQKIKNSKNKNIFFENKNQKIKNSKNKNHIYYPNKAQNNIKNTITNI